MDKNNIKIRVITIHGIPNFGSVFQSYALCEYLKRCGYGDTEVIDYNPKYFTARSVKSRIGRLLNWRAYATREQKFSSFVDEHIPLTSESYLSYQELVARPPEGDIFIAGGDQLWNVYHSCGHDDAFKLTFVSGKKISYGTSLGQNDFSDAEIKDLAEKIADFDAVAVRESGSVGLLRTAGVESTHVVDPVFLLDAEDYEELLVPPNRSGYLLVYLVTPSQLLEECIAYLSKKFGLDVILCSGFSKKCTCDLFLKDLGPDEILGYIKHADIVLSSSFHATAFAAMFEKQFFTILPDKHTNERITDILRIMKLSDRIITEASDLNVVLNSSIDYDGSLDYDVKIRESKRYLNNTLAQLITNISRGK